LALFASLSILANYYLPLSGALGEKDASVNNHIEKLKSHKWLSILIAIGVIVIALGSFTDAIGKISGFLNSVTSQPHNNEKISLHFKIINDRDEQVEIRPFAKYFLTEDEGAVIQEYEGGRLVLKSIDESSTHIIKANQTKGYYAIIPDSVAKSRLMERGAGTLHVELKLIGDNDSRLESIPLLKEAIEMYHLQYKVTPNK